MKFKFIFSKFKKFFTVISIIIGIILTIFSFLILAAPLISNSLQYIKFIHLLGIFLLVFSFGQYLILPKTKYRFSKIIPTILIVLTIILTFTSLIFNLKWVRIEIHLISLLFIFLICYKNKEIITLENIKLFFKSIKESNIKSLSFKEKILLITDIFNKTFQENLSSDSHSKNIIYLISIIFGIISAVLSIFSIIFLINDIVEKGFNKTIPYLFIFPFFFSYALLFLILKTNYSYKKLTYFSALVLNFLLIFSNELVFFSSNFSFNFNKPLIKYLKEIIIDLIYITLMYFLFMKNKKEILIQTFNNFKLFFKSFKSPQLKSLKFSDKIIFVSDSFEQVFKENNQNQNSEQLISKVKSNKYFQKILQHAKLFLDKFKNASLKQKVWLLRFPIIIFLLSILIKSTYQYFIPPQIEFTFPDNQAQELPLDSKIEINFTKQMDKESVIKAISINPEIKYDYSWETNQKLILTPKNSLERGSSYVLTINKKAKSTFFIPLKNIHTITFETFGHPQITLASPQSENLEKRAPITIMFDRKMIPLTTATNSAQKIDLDLEITPSIKGIGKWLGTTTYQFRPIEDYKKATTYTYTIKAGIKSKDGGITQEDKTYEFKTETPKHISLSPKEKYQYANPSASISATFNFPIDPESAKEHFALYEISANKKETSIPFELRFVDKQIGMWPNTQLKKNTSYKAEISQGLISAIGPNSLEYPITWNFKTIPEPKIIKSAPIDKQKNVQEENQIVLNFTSPMDEKSFKNNIIITPNPEISPKYYFYSYNSENTLRITSYLKRSTDYTITISGNVSDIYGTPLGNSYSFNFQTAELKPSISISPSGTYFATFNQEIIPRIIAKTSNSNKVNYSLYKIEKSDFYYLYNLRENYNNSIPEKTRSWQDYQPTKDKLIKTWEENYEIDPNVPVNVITKITNTDNQKLQSGLYFLDASIGNNIHDNIVMIIGKSTLTLKSSSKQHLVWAIDHNSGEPIPNMDLSFVKVTSKPFEILESGKTNNDGIFILDKQITSDTESKFLVFGEKDSDISVVSNNWDSGIQKYDFGLQSYYDPHEEYTYKEKQKELKIYLLVDRPIYRPNQTIYFKGVVRDDNDGIYTILNEGESVQVSLTNNQNENIETKSILLNSLGTFSGEFKLSEDCSLGNYNIKVLNSQNTFTQTIQVEEYKVPDYLVETSTNKEKYINNETIESEISSKYYFGSPLIDANLKWTLMTQDENYRWSKDTRFEFGDSNSYWYRPWWTYQDSYYSGEKVSEGEGTTDANGKYKVSIPQNISGKTTNQKLLLESVVFESESNQAISNSKVFYIYKSNIQIGLKPTTYYNKANEQSNIEIITVDKEGDLLKTIPVNLNFYKRSWNYIKEQDPDTEEFYWTNKPEDSLISSSQATTDDYGRAVTSFIPTEGGIYRITAEATDQNSNISFSAYHLWVSGFSYGLKRENHDRVPLIPNKQEYNINETASVFASLPYENTTALITLERAQVYDYYITKTNKDNQNFQFPIKENYSPNVYVSAFFVKPGSQLTDPAQIKMGISEIKVNNPSKKLEISLETDKKTYKPQETITLNINTKDGNSKNKKSEIAIALVDDAVWSLSNIELADIYKTFYSPRNLNITTFNTLTKSMDRINANIDFGSKGGSGGGCFTEKTLILIGNNTYTPISALSAGDTIYTLENENSNKLVKAEIEKVMIHDVDKLLLINNSIETTDIHRFYTKNGWKQASDLTKDDYLFSKDSQWMKIKSLEKINKKSRVYNLEIKKYHTFIADNIWVHNQKGEGFVTNRENFLDTAYWNAHLETDDNGNAQVQIKFPDNLTTFRLIAVAVDQDSAVGSNIEKLEVSKDILIQPHLPRFLSKGDKPILGASIHNQKSEEIKVSVSLNSPDINIKSEPEKIITIAPNSKIPVFWETEVISKEDNISINFQVKLDNQILDSITKKLVNNFYYTKEITATSGEINSSTEENVFLPEDIVKDMGQLNITLSPSIGAQILNNSKNIINYPYQCIEQTTSKIVTASALLSILNNSNLETITTNKYTKDYLKNYIYTNLQTITKAQKPDGGWGWWPEFESNPVLTALVLDGLEYAKNQDVNIADYTINRALDFIKLKVKTIDDINKEVYFRNVLAKYKEVDEPALSRLINKKWTMNIQGRIYLLLTLQNSETFKSEKEKLFSEIISLVKQTDRNAHWEENIDNWFFMSSSKTLSALTLESIINKSNKHPLINPTINWLSQTNKESSSFSNTKEGSQILKSVSLYLNSKNETNLDLNWKLSLNNNEYKIGNLESKDLFNDIIENINLSQLKNNTNNSIKLERSGKGSLYYNLNLEYYLPFERVESLDNGIVLEREILDKDQNIITNNTVKEGEDYNIRLILVTPEERHHIVIEDYLPAGFEAINNSLATTSILNKETIKPKDGNKPLYFKRSEIRDDKVVLFAYTLPKGIYEYNYKVRTTTPGIYHYSPAQTYNMYVPSISGHSSGDWLTVEEK